jgi:hypothetical protein
MCGAFRFFFEHSVNAMVVVICLWLPCQGQNIASSGLLQPLPDVVAGTPGTVVDTPPAPVVTYRDGQLAIDAVNSTLAEVLKLVAQKTGAVIDVPPGSGLERIVEHTGPARAEDVLTSLLNGSAFDFVIVGSPQPPHGPTLVLLSLHGADAALGKQDAPLASTAGGQEPELYGAGFRVDSSTADLSESSESVGVSASQPPQTASGDVIPGDVLDQLQKERLRQRQQQQQQQAQANQQ